jgi:hypothetical protein
MQRRIKIVEKTKVREKDIKKQELNLLSRVKKANFTT